MRSKFAAAVGIAALAIALMASLGTAGARPVAAAQTPIVVGTQVPTALASGTSVDIAVQIQGASPKQIDSGIEWGGSSSFEISGWAVRAGSRDCQLELIRDLGPNAVFRLTPSYNGQCILEIGASLGVDYIPFDATPLSTTIEVASPSIPSLPPPPTNVRIETQGLGATPVNQSTAYYQARVASDEDFLGGPRSAFRSVEVFMSGMAGSGVAPQGNATAWSDTVTKWIDSRKPITISMTYERYTSATDDIDEFVYQRDDIQVPIDFAQSAVFSVYPPATLLRCNTTKSVIWCQVGVANRGLTERTPVVPATAPVVVQVRSRPTGSARPTEWRTVTTLQPAVNTSVLSVKMKAVGATQEVRASIPGYSRTTVVVAPATRPQLAQAQWYTSSTGRLP